MTASMENWLKPRKDLEERRVFIATHAISSFVPIKRGFALVSVRGVVRRMEEENEIEELEESEKFEETKKVKMVEISYHWGKDGNGLRIIARDDDLSASELANLALRIYKKVKSL